MRAVVVLGLVVGCVAPDQGLEPGDPGDAGGADRAVGPVPRDVGFRDAAEPKDDARPRRDASPHIDSGLDPLVGRFGACPSELGGLAGTDIRVRVDFNGRYFVEPREDPDALVVHCDGQRVPGTLRFGRFAIELAPDRPLPRGARCEIVVSDNVRRNDVSLGGRTTFTVGDGDRPQLRLEPRQRFADVALHAVPAASDRDALIYGLFQADVLGAVVTTDGRMFVSLGASPTTPPTGDTPPSFAVSDDVIRVVWPTPPDATGARGVAYSRRDGPTFRPGALLATSGGDSAKVIARGRDVSVLWANASTTDVMRRRSGDGGRTFGATEVLAMGAIGYAVASNDLGAFAAIAVPRTLSLVHLAETTEVRVALRGWPSVPDLKMERIDGRRFLIQTTDGGSSFFTVIDGDGNVVIPPRPAPLGTVQLMPNGEVYSISPRGDATQRSRDQGSTFEDPIAVVDLGAPMAGQTPPSIRVTPDGALVFVWSGNDGARGGLGPQCQL